MDILEVLRHLIYTLVLAVALTIFTHGFPRRKNWGIRFVCIATLYCLCGVFIPDEIFNVHIPINTIVIFIFLTLGTRFLFRVSWKAALFCSIAASLLQHLTVHIYRVLLLWFVGENLPPHQTAVPFLFGWGITLCWLGSYVAMYLLGYFALARKNRAAEDVEIKSWKLICIVGAAILAIYVVWDLAIQWEQSNDPLLNIVSAIGCFALLDILYMTDQMGKAKLEEKLLIQLLAEEQAHYESLAANIEMVNRKCHDLKYQVSALSGMEEETGRKQQLQQLKEDIAIYENFAKTGNVALDNTISEKSLVCNKQAIDFAYRLDGKTLSFMDAVDVYVLFGNALDNAIECVQKYAEKEQRYILMQSDQRGNIYKIHIENYCAEPVVFKHGMPKTNKNDVLQHGYGVKSMRYIVEKYGGHLSVSQEKDRFCVDMIFPLSA